MPLAAVHLYRYSCCHGVRTVPRGLPDDDAQAVDWLGQEPPEGRDIIGDMDPGPQGGGQCSNTRTLGGGEKPFKPTRRRGVGVLEVGEDRAPAVVDDDHLQVGLLLTHAPAHGHGVVEEGEISHHGTNRSARGHPQSDAGGDGAVDARQAAVRDRLRGSGAGLGSYGARRRVLSTSGARFTDLGRTWLGGGLGRFGGLRGGLSRLANVS